MFTLFIKLKDDLTLSFPSFIREFIGTTNDGVTHLLDALKSVQLAQTNITGKIYSTKFRGKYFPKCAPILGRHCFQKFWVEFGGLQNMPKNTPQKLVKLAQKH